MAASNLPLLAGMVSTSLFVVSYLPMLAKAFRTRDLGSYSLGNLVLTNVGNGVHSVYVFSLPAGPIWFLHTFYLVSTVIMLAWHRRYAVRVTHDGGRYPAVPGTTATVELDQSALLATTPSRSN